MKKLFKKLITPFVLNNFPFKITTHVENFKRVLVKKGKIKEWRIFDSNGKRIYNELGS